MNNIDSMYETYQTNPEYTDEYSLPGEWEPSAEDEIVRDHRARAGVPVPPSGGIWGTQFPSRPHPPVSSRFPVRPAFQPGRGFIRPGFGFRSGFRLPFNFRPGGWWNRFRPGFGFRSGFRPPFDFRRWWWRDRFRPGFGSQFTTDQANFPPAQGFPEPQGFPQPQAFPQSQPFAQPQGFSQSQPFAPSQPGQPPAFPEPSGSFQAPATAPLDLASENIRSVQNSLTQIMNVLQGLVVARGAGAVPPGGANPPADAASAASTPAAGGTSPAAPNQTAGPGAQAQEFWMGEAAFPAPAIPQDLRLSIVRLARQEWQRWNSGGKKYGNDPRMSPILQDYWQVGVGQPVNATALASPEFHARHPWGAAFISWIMRRAGAGPAFPYSAAYSQIIEATRQNRSPFKIYQVNQVRPILGDLVCRWAAGHPSRSGGPQPSPLPRCYIVADIQPGQLIAVGVVRNSVGSVRIPTDPGGTIADPQTFAVIRPGSPPAS